MRASTAVQRQSTLRSTQVQNRDTDYLALRRRDHKNFNLVNHVLMDFNDADTTEVFSDNVQLFDNSMKPVDSVMLVTQTGIYLFNKKLDFQKRVYLKQIKTMVLIKTNASIFLLKLDKELPLLLQSFRRTELVVYLLC
jgi:Unconventional myosin tail, actin- and lipid-binding